MISANESLPSAATDQPASRELAGDHWSFQPLPEKSPTAGHSAWEKARQLDRFIDKALAARGLNRSAPADPVSLLRRLSLDLTGLPPTPGQMSSFLAACGGDAEGMVPDAAWEEVVDEFLASPRYGERWAQHWLDVVRYADTHGFEVNTERPHAWPYRDYVIRAFNEDTPYDRFIKEQIAGDALGRDAATGFLVTASVLLPGQIGKDAASMRLARQDALDEIVANIGQTFLGLSIGCARCHDHKFDPVSAKDYYAMQAFVAGVEYGDREMRTPETKALRRKAVQWREQLASVDDQLLRFVPLARPQPTTDRSGSETAVAAQRAAVHAASNIDRFEPVRTSRLRFTILATSNLEPCLDELEVFDTAGRNVALASWGTQLATSGNTVVADRHQPDFVHDGHYGNSRSWMSDQMGSGWVELTFPQVQEIERVVWGRDREGRFADRLAVDYRIEVESGQGWRVVADASDRRRYEEGQPSGPAYSVAGLSETEAATLQRLQEERAALAKKVEQAERAQMVFAGQFREPDTIHVLARGDPEQPEERVQPAVPAALGDLALEADSSELERRRQLANWIASPANPLTARVMANRIWQGHFGVGLVDTSSDFGVGGSPPTHPELLDWLAVEFIGSGWSVKAMHRLIVLSETYRQGSSLSRRSNSNPQTAAAAMKDAESRYLWRFPARRLEGEAIRDSILFVSGQLDETMFGRGFDLFDKRGGLTGFEPVVEFGQEGMRRMIYAHKIRRERDPVFGAFDCPDGGQSASRRLQSTTPIQALNLFNSRFVLDAARAFGERVTAETGSDTRAQIEHAYRLALSRQPTPQEISAIEPEVRKHGLDVLGRALFNCNEFLFMP